MLYCDDCGSFMRPKLSQRVNQNGELIYDYLCELKEKSKRQKCNSKRINGNELDKLVCEEIKKLTSDKSEFMQALKKEQRQLNKLIQKLKSKIYCRRLPKQRVLLHRTTF